MGVASMLIKKIKTKHHGTICLKYSPKPHKVNGSENHAIVTKYRSLFVAVTEFQRRSNCDKLSH